MKMPIEWHKRNLANLTAHAEKLEADFKRAENAFIKARCDVEELSAQIHRAELEGKDGFNQDRFKATK